MKEKKFKPLYRSMAVVLAMSITVGTFPGVSLAQGNVSNTPVSISSSIEERSEEVKAEDINTDENVKDTINDGASEKIEENEVQNDEDVLIQEKDAEKVDLNDTSEQLKASLLAVDRQAQNNEIWLDADAGSDTNDGKTEANSVKTYDKAVELLQDGGVLKVKKFDKNANIVFDKDATLEIAENISLKGGNTTTDLGIVMKKGHLRVSSGKTLSMSNYKEAITIEAGAELNDGRYSISGVDHALILRGKVLGSSREALDFSATTVGRGMDYTDEASFKNATIVLNAKSDSNDKGSYGGHNSRLYLDNVSMTTTDYRFTLRSSNKISINGSKNGYNLYMKNSELSVKGLFSVKELLGLSLDSQTFGVTSTRPAYIENSKVLIDGGRMTIGAETDIINSEIKVINSSGGGLNINWGGKVTFTNSSLVTENLKGIPSFGVQNSGGKASKESTPPNDNRIIFRGDSNVETPAKSTTVDNGGAMNGQTYAVTGGSFLIANNRQMQSGVDTVPTNGIENGDEKLYLMTLSDSSISSLNPLNTNGSTYTYSVANPSSDGKKHVWVPRASLTFKLGAKDAKFADNSSLDKNFYTIRGHRLDIVEGNSFPKDPTREGYRFDGWKVQSQTNMPGVDKQTEIKEDSLVNGDTVLVAKWVKDVAGGETKVDSDLDSNGNTTNEEVLGTTKTSMIPLSVSIDLSQLKNKVENIELPQPAMEIVDGKEVEKVEEPKDILVENLESNLNIRLSLPEKLKLDDKKFKISLDGGIFAVDETKAKVEGKTVSVGLKLQNPDSIKNYADLKSSLENLSSLKLNVEGVGFEKDAVANTNYTITAEVDGSFDARLVSTSSENTIVYNLGIKGQQAQKKEDVVKKDAIALTVKYDYVINEIKEETPSDIYVDLLSGEDSTNEKPLATTKDVSIPILARVDLSSIRSKIDSIEEKFKSIEGVDENNLLQNIGIEDLGLSLDFNIDLPDGMHFDKAKISLDENSSFVLDESKTSITEKSISSVINIDKSKIGSLADLKNLINRDLLGIKIEGAVFDKNSENDINYTTIAKLKSSLKGSFTHEMSGSKVAVDLKWEGRQLEGKEDKIKSDAIALSTRFSIEEKTIKPEGLSIPVDLESAGDSTEKKVKEVSKNSDISLTTVLDITGLKKEILGFEKAYPDKNSGNIAVENLESKFSVNINLPENMSFYDGAKILPEGDLETMGLKIDETSISKNSAKVVFSIDLGGENNIDSYEKLKKSMEKLGDELRVTATGVRFDKDAQADKDHTVFSEISGSFKSKYVHEATGNIANFDLSFNGTQVESKKDVVGEKIALTLRYKNNIQDYKPEKIELGSDLKSGDNSTEKDVLSLKKNSRIPISAVIELEKIKENLEIFEKKFGSDKIPALENSVADGKNLSLEDTNLEFILKFSLPEELGLEEGVTPKLDSEIFEIDTARTKVEEDSVTAVVKLKDPSRFKNLFELRQNIETQKNPISVSLEGAVFNKLAEKDTNYKVGLEVSGVFRTKATNIVTGDIINSELSVLGVQKDGLKDKVNPDGINLTTKYTIVEKDFPYESEVVSDILSGENTTVDGDLSVLKNSEISLTGTVDTTEVKNQLLAFERAYSNAKDGVINLENIESSFVATIELPDKMRFDEGAIASLDEGISLFKIDSELSEISEKKARIVLRISEDKDLSTYSRLKSEIESLPQLLKLNVSGVRFEKDALANTSYTVKSSVSGSFKAKATHEATGNIINFDMGWKGVQDEDKKDKTAPDGINLSVRYTIKEDNVSLPDIKILSDLRSGEDTTNEKALSLMKNSEIPLTGVVDTRAIKNQMLAFEDSRPGFKNGVVLENLDSRFLATLELPENISFKEGMNIVLDDGVKSGDSIFEIDEKSTKIENNKAEVVIVLKNKDEIDTYEKLKAAISKVSDEMTLTVVAKFDKDAQAGRNYTVKAGVVGNFKAKAISEITGNIVSFDFDLSGEQDDLKKDKVSPDGINLSVKFTTSEKHSSKNEKVEVDLRSDDNTTDTEVLEINIGEKLPLTGELDLSEIKKNILSIDEDGLKGEDEVKKLDLGFIYAFKAPKGINFTENSSVEKEDSRFILEKIYDKDKNEYVLKYRLSEKGGISTLEDLKSLVKDLPDTLMFNVDAEFDENAEAKDYEIQASSSVEFKSSVSKQDTGNISSFDYRWTGVQEGSKKDVKSPDGINLSLKLVDPAPEKETVVVSFVAGEGIKGYAKGSVIKTVEVEEGVELDKSNFPIVEADKGYKDVSWKNSSNIVSKENNIFTVEATKIISDQPTYGGGGGGYIPPVVDNNTERISGLDRIQTAVEVSKKSYPNGAKAVILAHKDKYTDVMTAVPLSVQLGAPILFTDYTSLPKVSADEITRLNPTTVYINGGENSVGKNIEDELKAKGYQVHRFNGVDRYDTARLIGESVRERGSKDVVEIASGENFPDALSLSSQAVKDNAPILLSRKDDLTEVTKRTLDSWNVRRINLAGGTSTISTQVENAIKGGFDVDLTKKVDVRGEIKNLDGKVAKVDSFVRLGGADRYETSSIIAKYARPESQLGVYTSGEVFADALVAGPYAGINKAPVLLVKKDSVPDSIAKYTKESKINRIVAVGGNATVSDYVLKFLGDTKK